MGETSSPCRKEKGLRYLSSGEILSMTFGSDLAGGPHLTAELLRIMIIIIGGAPCLASVARRGELAVPRTRPRADVPAERPTLQPSHHGVMISVTAVAELAAKLTVPP